MKIETSLAAAQKSGAETIIKDAEESYRCYFAGEIQRAVVDEPEQSAIAKELDSSPALDALVAAVAGMNKVSKDDFVASLESADPSQ